MKVKEINITKDLYLCSPLLNIKCPKTSCYINNGSCCHTVNKEHSQKYLLDCMTNLKKANKKIKKAIKDCEEFKEDIWEAEGSYTGYFDYIIKDLKEGDK